jgi:hypothetical protein
MSAPTTIAGLIATHNTYAPSAAEITAWNTVTKHASASTTVVTKAGLFGADLEKFNEDCVTYESFCDVEDYETFSGWAVGVSWNAATGNAVVGPLGVAFNGLGTLVQATFASGAAAVVKDIALTADATATAPAAAAVVPLASVNAFTNWSFKPVTFTLIAGEQTAFYFQDSDSDFYLEADDTDDLWATGDVSTGTQANVGSAGFVFKGAASLVAASASIIVASLLF